MSEPKIKQWATACATNEFISINTCSGYRRSARDPQGILVFYEVSVRDEELGEGLLQALAASRFLSLTEVGSFFEPKAIERNYEDRVARSMQRYGYKTRRELFKGMKHCMIARVDGVVTIKPSKHEKLEAWSGTGIGETAHEHVGANASPVDVGAALRRCFAKCI
jgi:hypothetical protein